jgi:hypothetical protein
VRFRDRTIVARLIDEHNAANELAACWSDGTDRDYFEVNEPADSDRSWAAAAAEGGVALRLTVSVSRKIRTDELRQRGLDLLVAPILLPKHGMARPFTPRNPRFVACPEMWHHYVFDRAINTTGLSPVGSQNCRLLHLGGTLFDSGGEFPSGVAELQVG